MSPRHRCLHAPYAPAALLLLAMIQGGAVTAAPLFPNPVYQVGSSPFGMDRADFDGDGHADLIVANGTNNYYSFEPGDLSLLRGVGDGSFAPETRIPLTRHPSDVYAADFNGDGSVDLAVVYYLAAAVLPGHGDGTFGPEMPFGGAGIVPSLLPGDFNDDARADLLLSETVNQSTTTIRALLGNADGTFTPGPVLASGALGIKTVADVNGDGRDDVLLVTGAFGPCSTPQTNTIRVYVNQGDGSFVQTGSFTTGYWNQSILDADIDGDGHVDLFIGAVEYENCSGYTGRLVYYGNGDGTFAAAGPFEFQVNTYDVLASDLNGDGAMDFVETDGWAVTTHLGHGDRTYTALPPVFAGSEANWLRTGHYDADGVPDLAILATWSEAVFIFAGNTDGSFGPPRIPALSGLATYNATTADLNGDGFLDIVASDLAADEVIVVLAVGNGVFGPETRYPVGVGADLITTADFNNDGAVDVAVAVENYKYDVPVTYPDGDLKILLGHGDGTLAAAVAYPCGQNPTAMTTDDFNADGATDVVIANWGDGWTTLGDLSLFLGLGDGTLQGGTRIAIGVRTDPFYDPTAPASLATGDFNHDGHRDLVVGIRGTWNSPQLGEVELLTGDGQGSFAPPATILVVAKAEGLAVGDFDQDGLEDIAVAEMASQVAYDPGGVIVLLSQPDGSFSQSPLLPAGPGPYEVGTADMTGDGILDLAVTNNGGYLALLPGLAGGAFGAPINFGLVGVPLALIRGDFDGDGALDLIVVSEAGVYLLRNSGAAPPPPPPLAIEASVAFGGGNGRRSATVTWTTSGEHDLIGFNIVRIDNQGRRQLNDAPIPCAECTTGAGHRYTYLLPRHQNIRELYVEALHADGSTDLFGPVPLARLRVTLQSPLARLPAVVPVP